MKGVLDTRAESGYDDDIIHRYHFPAQYRSLAVGMVGDWILYREPKRNHGRQAYVAVARVERLADDPNKPGMSYAYLNAYLAFDQPVPFVSEGRYAEATLRDIPDRSRVGAYLQGRSIRPLQEADFAAITRQGLSATLAPSNATRLELNHPEVPSDTTALLAAPVEEQERQIEQVLLNRKIRDANFRRQVCEAYDNRCAVTRLRIVNGGGRAEVQAAHVWPVASGGPDVVQNGVALSATAHWLFDRHLISLTDDYRLLVSHNKVPNELRSLFAKQMDRIHLPENSAFWPHPKYLAHHRERYASH